MWLRRHLILTLAAVAVSTAGNVHAQAPLSGMLGRWLEQEVAADLATKLDKHPKFRGETIALSAMQDGNIAEQPDALNRLLQKELIHHLNRRSNAQLAWQGQKRPPSASPVHYVLGIEVQPHGRFQHRVQLAMVDLDEGIWVSGVAYRWQGRLSSAEKALIQSSHLVSQIVQRDTGPLLPPMTFRTTRKSGVCANRSGARCVEVNVELKRPAYLFMLVTQEGRPTPLSCTETPSQRLADAYKFRIGVVDATHRRADAGVYALATTNQQTAQSLAETLRQTPGACGNAEEDSAAWTEQFRHLLAARSDDMSWRALHFDNTGRSLRLLR